MEPVYGRPYYVSSSHLSQELITAWMDGTFSIESEYGPSVDRRSLAEIETLDPVWGPTFVGLIHRLFFNGTHAACANTWVLHPRGDGFFRQGRCPTCGAW